MGTIPNVDVVEQMFTFDKDGKNSHLLDSDSKTLWPRISKMARQEGPEQFFGQYYSLFGKALRRGRADFLQEFLPTTAIGLLKSNNEWEDGTGGDGRGSLMQQAVDMGDTIAVRTIVDCWCAYLTKDPSSDTDLLYDPILGRVSMPDMLLLASSYPKEFQQLVCSVKLQPAAFNKMPVGAIFMYSDPDIVLEHYCAETLSVQPHLSVSQKPKRREKAYDVVSEEGDEDDAAGLKVSEKHLSDPVHKINRHQTYLFLPVQNAVHMDMMRAYTATCEVLDSVAIFDSEMGQLALSYAWRTIGIRAHVKALSLYGIFVMIATAGTLSFKELHTDPKLWLVSLLLIVSQLLFDAYFVNKEKEQFIVAPLEYLSDVWNLIDFNVIVSNVSGNLLRLCFWQEGYASRILLSWCSVFMFFNALYFLRAFESTGPLVSMIMQICSDIRHLLLVLLLVLLGFAQAFWLVANTRDDLAFSTIQDSLINSFSFMLGNYDPEAFVGADLESFGNILTAFYMVTMAILLLNLLIALMGDSYGAVKEKGLAQWKYEQAMIITEMQGSMEESDTRREDTIYFRKNTEDLTTEVEVQEDVRMENVESAVKAMQHQQGVLMKQQEALLKLVGDQSAMLEQLLGAKPA
ncbi:hypothetical protein B484DRAFT_156260 [Ochromonadaceae sp. CCMP2298]|nr:hypothetical protein B484DRAFT_156260 [Ochromonadaceae sp. CCMP2298]